MKVRTYLTTKVKVKVGARLNRFRFALGRKMPSLCVVLGGDNPNKMANPQLVTGNWYARRLRREFTFRWA